MDDRHILATRDGRVIHLRLNRPAKRNALTRAMYSDMAETLAEAEADPTVHAVLFSGEGASFAAGNDLQDFLDGTGRDGVTPVTRFLRAIATSTVPLVAAVHGNAVGIGTTMLLHCDFVLAAEDTVFRMPFVDLGLVPEAASSLLLPRLVGLQKAASMLMLGTPFTAAEARDFGLVHSVTPDAAAALAAARDIAATLAQKPAGSLRGTRRLLRGDTDAILARIDLETAMFSERLSSPQFKAAAEAFLRK